MILAIAATAQANVVVQVNQVGNTFVPDEITVRVGDVVQWNYTDVGIAHTVTSGTGAADPETGALFDAPLTLTDTTFRYTITEQGDIDYYCIPHELVGMVGVIHVHGNAAPISPVAMLMIGGLLLGVLEGARRRQMRRS